MPIVNEVIFTTDVGGSGLRVTDDGHPDFGLDNDGHRKRFVPSLSEVVKVAKFTVTKVQGVEVLVQQVLDKVDDAENAAIDAQQDADNAAASAILAEKWASQVTFPVADTRWSAREYANQAKSTADSMVNNIGLSRVDGGDAMTSAWAITINGGGASTVFTAAINCGNAI